MLNLARTLRNGQGFLVALPRCTYTDIALSRPAAAAETVAQDTAQFLAAATTLRRIRGERNVLIYAIVSGRAPAICVSVAASMRL